MAACRLQRRHLGGTFTALHGVAPLILVSNDDGIHSAGLAALADALAPIGDVVVVAPDREQSACSHALTLHRPLRIDDASARSATRSTARRPTA